MPDQSDSFYSHFPSFNNQNKQREQLVQNRHQEYRDHLVKVRLEWHSVQYNKYILIKWWLVQVAEKEASETKRKQHVKDVYNQDHPTVANGREELVDAPYSTST